MEVADSSLAFDQQQKVPLDVASGLSEVWLVNLVEKKVTAYRKPEGTAYSETVDFIAGQSMPLPGFPGKSIAVADIGL